MRCKPVQSLTGPDDTTLFWARVFEDENGRIGIELENRSSHHPVNIELISTIGGTFTLITAMLSTRIDGTFELDEHGNLRRAEPEFPA